MHSAAGSSHVTQFTEDDGQALVFVCGGDLAPNPASSPVQPKARLWAADPTGAKPAAKLVEGDAPAVSSSHSASWYAAAGS